MKEKNNTRYIFPLALLSGIGHGLTVITPSFWLNSVGISYTKIGLFSLASAAYGFSLFWIPLLDKIDLSEILKKYGLKFGDSIQRKGFIFITVLLSVLCFLFASVCDPTRNMLELAIPIALAAFALATADSVMLAYSHETLQPKDMGANTAAYRLGIFTSSALALFVHENLHVSWPYIYRYLSLVMFALMCVIFFSPKEKKYKPRSWQESFVLPYQNILSTYKFALINIVVFMALYKMHDRFVAPMEQLFLLKKLGPNLYSTLKTISTFALSFSAIKSSNFLNRFGYKKTFMTAIFASVVTVVSYFLCTFDITSYYAIAVIISGVIATIFYYTVGSKMWPMAAGLIGLAVYMIYSGLYAQAVSLFVVVIVAKMTSGIRNSVLYSYQTSLCSKEYALTQVTLMTNIERLLLGTFLQGVSGFCVTRFNWSGFYMITIAMSIMPLVLINFIMYPSRDKKSQEKVENNNDTVATENEYNKVEASYVEIKADVSEEDVRLDREVSESPKSSSKANTKRKTLPEEVTEIPEEVLTGADKQDTYVEKSMKKPTRVAKNSAKQALPVENPVELLTVNAKKKPTTNAKAPASVASKAPPAKKPTAPTKKQDTTTKRTKKPAEK